MRISCLSLAAVIIAMTPVSYAFAQSTETTSTYAPGSANAPMHPDHDKAKAVRTDNRGHISRKEAAKDTQRQ
jgi:hypothetical protein